MTEEIQRIVILEEESKINDKFPKLVYRDPNANPSLFIEGTPLNKKYKIAQALCRDSYNLTIPKLADNDNTVLINTEYPND